MLCVAMVRNYYGLTYKGNPLIILPETDTLGIDHLCITLPNRWPDCVKYLNEYYSDIFWTAKGTTLKASFPDPFQWEILEKEGRIMGIIPDLVDLNESTLDALELALDMLRMEEEEW